MPLTQQEKDELELLQLEEEEHQQQMLQEKPLDLANLPNEADFGEKMTSLGLGAAQGATLGFADEAEGAIKGAYGRVSGEGEDLTELYRKYRDLSRKRYEEAQNKAPGYYMGGEVLGGLSTLAVPGLNAVKAGGAGLAMAEGAGLGAAAALGSSNADLTTNDPEALKQAELDIALGAGFGGTAASVGRFVTKTAPELAETLSSQYEAGKRVRTQGRTILGEEAEKRINKEITDSAKLALDTGENLQKKMGSYIQESRKGVEAVDQQKYTDFLDSQLNKIDNFVKSKQGKTIDSFPELKKMRDTLDELRNGVKTIEEVPEKEIQKLPGKPSSIKKLQEEANKLNEQSKLSGETSSYDVIETTGDDGKKYASLIKRNQKISEKSPEVLKPVRDANGDLILDEFGQPKMELVSTGQSPLDETLKVKTVLSEPETPPSEKVIERLTKKEKRITPNLAPSGEDVASSVKDISGLAQNVLEKENLASAKDTAALVRSEAKKYLEGISPDVAEANKQYAKLQNLDRLFGTVTGTGEKGLVGAPIESESIKDISKLRSFLENAQRDTQGGRRSSELLSEELEPRIKDYSNNLRELANNFEQKGKKADADEFRKAAQDLEAFLNKGKMASEDFAARNQMKSSGITGIPALVAKYAAYGTGRSKAAGAAVKAVEKTIQGAPQTVPSVFMPEKAPEPTQQEENKNKPVNSSQNIYKLTNKDLIASTEVIRQIRPEIADKLEDAINNGDEQKKKAMQFVIAQDPKLRQLFNT